MIVFITKDLMIQSSAAANAHERHVVLETTANVQQAVESLAGGNVELLLLDLQTPNLDLTCLLARLSGMECRPATIAFAQHVEVQLLQSANQPEIDQVMTRGQFSRNLPDIISRVAQSR